ncbi:hypothetical protein PR048_004955 [Dryococelus australis]|uniref:Uncharacterized protein n=1 Tax=Dryococelus australis TaxID=614101 RepID=A0ABQ9I7Z2_9NEOP|nr:hypothetical protein PR048_004955 [Dryococelus australis]
MRKMAQTSQNLLLLHFLLNLGHQLNESHGYTSDETSDLNLAVHKEKPSSENVEYVFCQGKFSEDTHGDEWVQCTMCELCVHTDCSGAETLLYVCDFCK